MQAFTDKKKGVSYASSFYRLRPNSTSQNTIYNVFTAGIVLFNLEGNDRWIKMKGLADRMRWRLVPDCQWNWSERELEYQLQNQEHSGTEHVEKTDWREVQIHSEEKTTWLVIIKTWTDLFILNLDIQIYNPLNYGHLTNVLKNQTTAYSVEYFSFQCTRKSLTIQPKLCWKCFLFLKYNSWN